jgi:hypothetical protein
MAVPRPGSDNVRNIDRRQKLSNYGSWRKVYDDAGTIRARYGCTGELVLRSPKDHDLVFITHNFPTVEQAEAFAADPELHSAMANAGVIGDPGIEIFEDFA